MLHLSMISTGVAVVSQVASFAAQSVKAIHDPTNGDAVSAVGELSSLDTLEYVKSCMMADKCGRSILKDQPYITDEVLESARKLPDHTFGHRYASYMDANHFSPSGRTPVRHIADPTLAYIMTRYRQTHDFLHTLAGCGRTVDQELAIKLLEWQHTGLPLGLLAVVGGAPHLTSSQRCNMKVYWEWARQNAPRGGHEGRAVRFYLNVPWEAMLEKPYEVVVSYTGVIPLPVYMAERVGQASKRPAQENG